MTAILLTLSLLAASPGPAAANASADASVTGKATWYRYHPGQAAAGPALRKALGRHWRGKWVTVTANGRTVRVKLTDWCACGLGRVIDLDPHDFAHLAPLSRGVVRVSVTTGATIPLPATDTAPRRTHGWALLS